MAPTDGQQLIVLAKQIAVKFKLVPELVCAVVEQESGWKPWAMRYEPAFLAKYVAPLYTNGKISATEAYARSISWGLLQVMGQVAREHGVTLFFLSQLCEPEVGLSVGCEVLASKLEREGGDVIKGLLRWNGGANPSYATEVLARVDKYK
ncbi:MAG: transglycosylase SLT domain-containing protein [Candidatus Acidiferrum sp.]